MTKKVISYLIILLIIPVLFILCVWLYKGKNYMLFSLIIGGVSIVPFFLMFEKGKPVIFDIVLVSVMTAVCVVIRCAFAFVPYIKPVTAVIIMAGIYLGAVNGFMVGSLTAFVSNMFLGQGVWTIFQMIIWGLTGFLAGVLSKPFKKEKLLVVLYGAVSGVLFSLFMDIWTVLSMDGYFNVARYLVILVPSLPFMAMYMLSNVIFIFTFYPSISKVMNRMLLKYSTEYQDGNS